MTTPEQFTERETLERDERLNRWFTDFFALNKYDMTELQYILDKSWMRYVQDHAFSLARDKAFGPPSHLVPRTEEQIEQLLFDEETEDEDHIHDIPLEKPKTFDEARRLIRIATGGEVSTVTSWVLVMQSKKGSTLEFLNILA